MTEDEIQYFFGWMKSQEEINKEISGWMKSQEKRNKVIEAVLDDISGAVGQIAINLAALHTEIKKQ